MDVKCKFAHTQQPDLNNTSLQTLISKAAGNTEVIACTLVSHFYNVKIDLNVKVKNWILQEKSAI